MAALKFVVLLLWIVSLCEGFNFEEIEARLYKPEFKNVRKHWFYKVFVIIDDMIEVIRDSKTQSKWYKVVMGTNSERMASMTSMWDSLVQKSSFSQIETINQQSVKNENIESHSEIASQIINKFVNLNISAVKDIDREMTFRIDADGRAYSSQGHELTVVQHYGRNCVVITLSVHGSSRSFDPRNDFNELSIYIHVIDWTLITIAIPRHNVFVSLAAIALFFMILFGVIYILFGGEDGKAGVFFNIFTGNISDNILKVEKPKAF